MTDFNIRLILEAVAKNKGELEKVKKDLDGIGAGGKSAGGGLAALAKKALGTVSAMGLVYTAGQQVINYLKDSVKASAEAEMAEAKRNAIFETTNAETRTSIELLDQYASQISLTTYVDDELVISQEKLLLQFRSLGGDLIPMTLQAAIDMAGGFQGDVLGSTERLGRTLELVAQGGESASMALSQLRRSGIILDQTSQSNILSLSEQGKTVEAQTALLNALNDIVGGQAVAAADTMLGAEQRLNNALENQKEIVGGPLQKAWTDFLNFRAQGVENANEMSVLTEGMTTQEVQGLHRAAAAAGMSTLAYARLTLAKEASAGASKDLIDYGIDPEIERTRELESAKRMLAAAMSGDLTKAIEQHKTQLKELTQNGQELQTELESLVAKGYAPTSEKVLEVKAAMSQNTDAIARQNAELRKNTAMMIFNNAAAHLDAKGQLELAKGFGLANVKDLEMAASIEALTEKYDVNHDGLISAAEGAHKYMKEVDALRRQLLGIPPYIETEVYVQYTQSGTPPPGGGCFLAGTLISMADGTRKPIERVNVGEFVFTYDFKADEVVQARVAETFHHTKEETRRYLVINHRLRVTPNHLIWTQNRDWIGAGALQLGDQLELLDGHTLVVTRVDVVDDQVEVFNLHVEHPDHNYYANGVLVHNSKTTDNDNKEFSSGADFIVPPGYPNDSFPFRAESGERVIVIPADRMSNQSTSAQVPAGKSVHIQNMIVQGVTFDEILQRINDAGGNL
jgi:Hint module